MNGIDFQRRLDYRRRSRGVDLEAGTKARPFLLACCYFVTSELLLRADADGSEDPCSRSRVSRLRLFFLGEFLKESLKAEVSGLLGIVSCTGSTEFDFRSLIDRGTWRIILRVFAGPSTDDPRVDSLAQSRCKRAKHRTFHSANLSRNEDVSQGQRVNHPDAEEIESGR